MARYKDFVDELAKDERPFGIGASDDFAYRVHAAGLVDGEAKILLRQAIEGQVQAEGAARRLVRRMLPGWLYRVAECCVSDDAAIMPDYNDPEHGERLKREYDVDFWERDHIDVDRRPSGQPALALVEALFRTLALIEERGEPLPRVR